MGVGIAPSRIAQLRRLGVSKSDDSIFGDLLRKGHDEDFEPKRFGSPTSYAPGSVGKVEVLSERLVRGEELFHPDDERCCASREEQALLNSFLHAHHSSRR